MAASRATYAATRRVTLPGTCAWLNAHLHACMCTHMHGYTCLHVHGVYVHSRDRWLPPDAQLASIPCVHLHAVRKHVHWTTARHARVRALLVFAYHMRACMHGMASNPQAPPSTYLPALTLCTTFREPLLGPVPCTTLRNLCLGKCYARRLPYTSAMPEGYH